jgi:GntR family transcriptional regulator
VTRTRRSAGPKYQAIADALRATIESGELAPGQALPSQRELAESWGVTVMTVRQAVNHLTEAGLAVTEHGRGTFVAPRRFPLPLGPLTSLDEEAMAAGRRLDTIVLEHGSTAQAYRIVRLRCLDGEPFALQTSHLPLQVAARIDPERLTDKALYSVLADALVVVTAATESVRAVQLDPESARILQRNPGAAALLSIRESRTAAGEVVVTDRALVPGDLGMVTVERARLHPDPHPTRAPEPSHPSNPSHPTGSTEEEI